MRNHLIVPTRDHIDGDAARALMEPRYQAEGRGPRANWNLWGDGPSGTDEAAGLYGFILAVERLFGPNPNPEYGESRVVLPDGTRAWNVAYHQGVGDYYGLWVANVEWFDREFPTLLDTLGITVSCSAGLYGVGPADLPARKGEETAEPAEHANIAEPVTEPVVDPDLMPSGLTFDQDAELRDAIRAAFTDIPGYYVGPAMKPLMDAIAPVVVAWRSR